MSVSTSGPRPTRRSTTEGGVHVSGAKEMTMPNHTIVSREEWLEARRAHLAREKEFTRLRDQLSAVHLAQRDVTLLAVSRAPLRQIEAFKRRMGWRFTWVSSHGTDFNFDYRVSFTRDEIAKGSVDYNFGLREFPSEEAPGISVFYKDEHGDVFHTYSAYARGLDLLVGAYNYLDLAPKGRDEGDLAFTMAWVRHHDRY